MKPRSTTEAQISLKCVIVGDLKVKKNELLYNYKNDNEISLKNYIPWIVENYCKKIEIDNKNISLTMWDTSGQEEYDQMRKLSYLGANIGFILFNLYDKNSFENALNKWCPEIINNNKKISIIFLGNHDKNTEINEIAVVDAQTILNKKGFLYLECQDFSPDVITKVITDSISLYMKSLEGKDLKASEINKIKKPCNLI